MNAQHGLEIIFKSSLHLLLRLTSNFSASFNWDSRLRISWSFFEISSFTVWISCCLACCSCTCLMATWSSLSFAISWSTAYTEKKNPVTDFDLSLGVSLLWVYFCFVHYGPSQDKVKVYLCCISRASILLCCTIQWNCW